MAGESEKRPLRDSGPGQSHLTCFGIPSKVPSGFPTYNVNIQSQSSLVWDFPILRSISF